MTPAGPVEPRATAAAMTASASPSLAMRRGSIDLSYPVFVVLALTLATLVILPLFWLGLTSLTTADGSFTLANFSSLVSEPALRKPFVLALTMALAVGLVSCLIAVPLAWLVARTDLMGRGVVRALITASFVTPPFLGAIAWELLAAPNSGMLNEIYRWTFKLDPYEYLFDVYTFEGLVFVIACYSYPFVFTLVVNALDRVPADLEEASAMLGGGLTSTLRKVTLPLVMPAILAGALISILQAMTMFGTPAILALPAGFHVITTKIWSLFQYPPKPGLAAAAALPLLLISVGLIWLQGRITGRRGFTTLGGKSGAPKITDLGWAQTPALLYVVLVLTITVGLPYLALLKTAVTRTVSEPLSLDSLTLRHVNFVFFEFSATKLALWNTLVLGVLSATVATTMALLIAYLVARRSVPGASWLGVLATAPAAIPGIVLGVGIFLSYSRPSLMLYGTLWILLIAFVTIELPGSYQQLASAFKSIHPELEEASRVLGASRLTALWQITAPLLRTSVIATWCFVFIGTIRELSATILLTTAKTKLVSVIIYDLNESGDLGAIAVLGLLLLVISFAVVMLANRLPVLGGRRLETPR